MSLSVCAVCRNRVAATYFIFLEMLKNFFFVARLSFTRFCVGVVVFVVVVVVVVVVGVLGPRLPLEVEKNHPLKTIKKMSS